MKTRYKKAEGFEPSVFFLMRALSKYDIMLGKEGERVTFEDRARQKVDAGRFVKLKVKV